MAPSDNFDAFIHVVREWSFIRLLKRAGIECLACPRPGVNIPEHVDPDGSNAWEDTLYVGMDANFRLERFNVSSEDKDPGLSKGLHILWTPKSTMKRPKVTREVASEQDLAASGWIYMLVRLKLKWICYLTAVRRFRWCPWIVTSYDIACQWSINLEERINIYSDVMRPKIPKKVYLVPKFHLPGHIKDCQEKYCMSFHIHVGENDGEAPECSWAISNGVAASTREMGPGHRREKLDQHFGDFNWQKNVSQGDTLLRKIKDAVPKASEHEDRFKLYSISSSE
ncbi:hypothetical protein IW261DRAFT_1613327 [Armillaria novae-zelandiae]|uniref:Uncharacterized protein n=1 Tax=Armillaria novae-zelandiae TaxID=153914 RepID=A0AA39NHL2_9AGAR|nr:hypothetical protein IW261DRAFT_1613327 [Armillaria novae-zelandiae]